jgi:GNAT superfamily N-acetyltransferase
MPLDTVVPCPQVTLRPAVASDAEGLRRFLAGLSERSAYLRFFTGLGQVPTRMLTWLLPQYPHRMVLLATGIDGIVGHGMYATVPGEDGAVDVAVVVTDAWQRCGLGVRLIEGLLDVGLARGVRELRFTVLAGNLAAHRLIAHFWPGAQPTMDEGVYEYVLPVDQPTGNVVPMPMPVIH